MLSAAALLVSMLASLPAPAGAATSVQRYSPFTRAGTIKPSVHVAERRTHGDCPTGGIAGRFDAWRCMTGRLLHDPCFESPVADLAVCPRVPGSRRAVLLVRPRFDRRYANTSRRGRVWAIRAGGRRCVAVSGARGVVHGRIATMACVGRGGVSVWGGLDRSRPTWRALIGSYERPSGWRWVKVGKAWR